MNCQLKEVERFKSKDELEFKTIEEFITSDHLDLFLCQCAKCGELYLGCFIEITLGGGDEDCWNFWVPISEEEIKTVRNDHRKGFDLIQSRKRIAWTPDNYILWRDCFEMVLCIYGFSNKGLEKSSI